MLVATVNGKKSGNLLHTHGTKNKSSGVPKRDLPIRETGYTLILLRQRHLARVRLGLSQRSTARPLSTPYAHDTGVVVKTLNYGWFPPSVCPPGFSKAHLLSRTTDRTNRDRTKEDTDTYKHGQSLHIRSPSPGTARALRHGLSLISQHDGGKCRDRARVRPGSSDGGASAAPTPASHHLLRL